MRILLVGNAHHDLNGARYYNPEAKLHNGFVRNGHAVHFFSPKDIARSSTIFRSSRIGQKHSNAAFLDTVRIFKPQMIVFIHSVHITEESFLAAKAIQPGVRLAQICVDPLFRPKNRAVLERRAAIADASFITTAGPAIGICGRPGAPVSFIPNWIDPAIETGRAFERSDLAWDVFFAARAHVGEYEGDPRFVFPLAIESSGDISIDIHGVDGRPALHGAAFYERMTTAKMGLNLNGDRQGRVPEPAPAELRYLYNSDRVAQVMGSGLLALSTRANRLYEMFAEGETMVFADTLDEMFETIRRYKRDDQARRKIAEAGWRKAHADYSVDLVTRYIEEVTFEKPLSHAYQWPTEFY
jgi:Glycosyl transferases group 1